MRGWVAWSLFRVRYAFFVWFVGFCCFLYLFSGLGSLCVANTVAAFHLYIYIGNSHSCLSRRPGPFDVSKSCIPKNSHSLQDNQATYLLCLHLPRGICLNKANVRNQTDPCIEIIELGGMHVTMHYDTKRSEQSRTEKTSKSLDA